MNIMRNIKIILFVLLSLFLSSCAAPPEYAPQYVPVHMRSQLGNIGIISLMGDEMRLNLVTNSIITNRSNIANVKHWQIDQKIVQHASERLTSLGYTAKTFDYDRAELFKVYTRKNFNTDKQSDRISPQLSALARQHGIDTFLILYRGFGEDFVGKSAEPLGGYGLYNLLSRNVTLVTATYAILDADVINAKTGQLIASVYHKYYYTKGDETIWHWDYEEKTSEPVNLSAKKEPQLKKMLTSDITRAVDSSIGGIGFSKPINRN